MSGTVGDLSPEQEQALKSFRESLTAPEVPADFKNDDHLLLRFLRARKFNLVQAKEMFMAMVTWRAKNHVDQMGDYDPPKAAYFRRAIAFSYHGFDKSGRPLYIEKTGRASPEFLINFFTDDEILKAHLWSMEISIKRFQLGMRLNGGKYTEKFASVLDFEGVTMDHRHAMHVVKMISSCDSNYYPERMGWLAIVNAPAIFPMLWSVAKSFIDPVTAAKVHVFGSDYQAKLLELVDASNLPVEYGGSCALGCVQHVSGATAKCCVPFFSNDELWAEAKTDDDKQQYEDVVVENRDKFILKIEAKEGHEHSWHFHTAKHDIEFSVEFTPANSQEVEVIVAPKRIPHSTAGFQSLYIARRPGTIKLTWDNTHSVFTSKKLKYALKCVPYVPSAHFCENMLILDRKLAERLDAQAQPVAAAAAASSQDDQKQQ